MNRKLKFSLICFFFVVLASYAFAEVNLAKLVKEIQPSIVTVLTYDKEGKVTGQGSGFFINRKGHLITNYHVLQGAYTAEIKTYDGKIYPVKSVLAENEDMDLVKLSVDIREASFKWLAVKSTLPTIAERIVVIGSPLGLEQTVSEGIVSGVREIPDRGKVLQISAPISPGSSGSPAVNMDGQVIGVVTFYLIKGQNLNFAVPSKYILDLKQDSPAQSLSNWTEKAIALKEIKKRLKPKRTPQGRLFIYTKPKGARIRILNIKPKFYQGIILKPRRYHVEVSADGYETAKKWIKIELEKDKNLQISLKKLPQVLTKYKKEIEPYKQAIRINPDDASAHFDLGFACAGLGRYTEAVDAYKQAIRINPDYARAHYFLGHAYQELGRYSEEIEAYKQVVRINPDDANVHFALGMTYEQRGRYRESIEAFKQVVRISPDYALAYSLLGVGYKELGRYRESIEAFKQVVRIKPDDANSHYSLGLAYQELGRYTEAVDAYKQAIRINPDDANSHSLLGDAYSTLERNGEAIDAYKQVIRIKPDDAYAHYSLGSVYEQLERYTEAIKAFKQAIRIKPDDAYAHYNLGYTYYKLGRYGEAIDASKQAIRINPDEAVFHSFLGSVYFELDRYGEAVDAVKQAIRIKPDDANDHSFLGDAYSALNRYGEAVDAYKQAIRIKPDDAYAHYSLGATYLFSGNTGSALDQYKILKTLDKNKANELFNLIYK